MNIHIDYLKWDLDEKCCDRMAVARNQVAICCAQGSDQKAVLHRTGVDEEILLIGHPAVEGWKADHTSKSHSLASTVDTDAVTVEFMRKEFGHPRRRFSRQKRQNASPVVFERERYIASCHREPTDSVETGRIFRARRAQELAPSRHLVK